MAGNVKEKKIKELSRDEIRRICAHFKKKAKDEGDKRNRSCCFWCPLCTYFDQDDWGNIDSVCVKDWLNVKVEVPEE